jgi:hypothetical protein
MVVIARLMTRRSAMLVAAIAFLTIVCLVVLVIKLRKERPEQISGLPAAAVKQAQERSDGASKANADTGRTISRVRAGGYYVAHDLTAYIGGLQATDNRPGSVELARAKSIGECGVFNIQPNYAADTVRQRQLFGHGDIAIVRKYATELEQRCANFQSSQPTSLADAGNLYSEAAQKGNLEAQAHLLNSEVLNSLANPSTDLLPLDHVRSSVLAILGSGDPDAIFELSGFFGPDSVLEGPAAGSEKAVAAWQLVACDIGLDCSANLLRSFCLNGGMYCGPGDLRQNMSQAQFTPADFEQVLALETAIYAALASGDIESLFSPQWRISETGFCPRVARAHALYSPSLIPVHMTSR